MCYVLEDEFCFILECPLYMDLITELISKYFGVGQYAKNVELCMSEHINRQKKSVSMFIEKTLKLESGCYITDSLSK